MLTVRVGGVWLRQIGAWTGLTVTHSWPHGSEEVTWQMMPTVTHPALHGGALVEVLSGGIRIWRGKLNQPTSLGDFSARGIYSEAAGTFAFNGTSATNVPDTAIVAAITRGALSWGLPSSFSASAWGTAGEALPLLQLLDGWADGQGTRWYVDPDGSARSAVDPTTPSYYVPHAVAGHGLALAEDAYYSHLTGSYMSGVGTFATVTVGDSAAAAKWGYKEARVDLTPMGIIASGTATTEVTNRLALSGARIGFAENLQLGPGQITTAGGTAAALSLVGSQVGSGLMIRLMGVADETRVTQQANTDIVIAKSVYSDTDRTLTLTPMGKAPRNLQEILTVSVAA